ncbi:MAG: helix-turn-helix transcriptional regulator [Proteobacteria bacterium]|jgi:DNA-binding XRE family transcriptional regulator|nr:helix-turn-helix transcriptional regulator [Pseudomonadota bacterium]
MQVVVKTPRIEINIKGIQIPARLMEVLKEEYGHDLNLVKSDEDEVVDVFETSWYKEVSERMTPGKYLAIYRKNKKLTQEQLGKALGGVPRQHISNMERGRRAISLKMARNLSAILDTPIERFVVGSTD